MACRTLSSRRPPATWGRGTLSLSRERQLLPKLTLPELPGGTHPRQTRKLLWDVGPLSKARTWMRESAGFGRFQTKR